MWIVRLALRRPYTVAIMVLLILSMGLLSLSRMIVDIFPVIDIPVVIVVWNYPGLSPEDMERRVVLIRSSRSPRPSADVALVRHRVSPENISHYTVQRVVGVDLNVGWCVTWGFVSRDIRTKIDELGKLPPGVRIRLRGQNEVMEQSFRSLGLGLILAIMLVYFLIVVLFPVLAGPVHYHHGCAGRSSGSSLDAAPDRHHDQCRVTHGGNHGGGDRHLQSILLVSFANDARAEEGKTALEAVAYAAGTRLRPVLMTALAMTIGMLPMALAFGEAGEQNAPLGRAVIGGLLIATVQRSFWSRSSMYGCDGNCRQSSRSNNVFWRKSKAKSGRKNNDRPPVAE